MPPKNTDFSEADFKKEINKILKSMDIPLDPDGNYPEEVKELWPAIQSKLGKKLLAKNWRVWTTMWTNVIGPTYVSAAKEAAKAAGVKYTGEIGAFAKKYHRDHGLALCKTLTETDLQRVQDQIVDNWGIGEKAFEKKFQDDYIGSDARLKTIYRSEHARAISEGTLEVGQEVGHTYKQWWCAEDERSCEICMAHHEETVPMDEAFSGGYAIPQDSHPSCRCVLITLEESDLSDDQKARMASRDPISLDDLDPTFQDSPWKSNEAFRQVLNYKCKSGTVDESNKCSESTNIDVVINPLESFNNFEYELDSFHKIPAEMADSKLIKYNSNILKYSESVRIAGMRLIHRTGDNNHQIDARIQIKQEIFNNTELGKYLNDKIIAETKAFEENPTILYRAGQYNKTPIESYTTNPKGAFTNNFNDVPPGNDFSKTYDELKKDGWKVLNGILQNARYPEEEEITLINFNKIHKQNSVKLNYKCPENSHGPGFSCGGEEPTENLDTKSPHDSVNAHYTGFYVSFDFEDISDKNSVLSDKIQQTLKDEAHTVAILSNDERDVIKNYSLMGYSVNEYLYKRKQSTDQKYKGEIKTIETFDNIFKNNKLKNSIITFRGISKRTLNKDKDFYEALHVPGTEIKLKGYSSSSIMPFVAAQLANVDDGYILEMKLPKGSEALYIAKESTFPWEEEVLINRNTNIKIGSSRTERVMIESGNFKDMEIISVELITDRNNKQKQNSTQKLNYKCKSGTVDDSNKCNEDATESTNKRSLINSKLTDDVLEKIGKQYDSATMGSSRQDMRLNRMAKLVGFDGKPKVISEAELEQYATENKLDIMYRGVSSSKHAEQFRTGEYWAGKGLNGNGTYAAYGSEGKSLAKKYAPSEMDGITFDDCVMKMCMTKDAKIINYDDLISKIPKVLKQFPNAKKYIGSDEGKIATILGYDAIRLPPEDDNAYKEGSWGNMIILNRSKVMVVK